MISSARLCWMVERSACKAWLCCRAMRIASSSEIRAVTDRGRLRSRRRGCRGRRGSLPANYESGQYQQCYSQNYSFPQVMTPHASRQGDGQQLALDNEGRSAVAKRREAPAARRGGDYHRDEAITGRSHQPVYCWHHRYDQGKRGDGSPRRGANRADVRSRGVGARSAQQCNCAPRRTTPRRIAKK